MAEGLSKHVAVAVFIFAVLLSFKVRPNKCDDENLLERVKSALVEKYEKYSGEVKDFERSLSENAHDKFKSERKEMDKNLQDVLDYARSRRSPETDSEMEDGENNSQADKRFKLYTVYQRLRQKLWELVDNITRSSLFNLMTYPINKIKESVSQARDKLRGKLLNMTAPSCSTESEGD